MTDDVDVMDLSIVIPVRNEAENIVPLVAEIRAALEGSIGYEVIFVDDGSEDPTPAEVVRLATEIRELRLIRHAECCGQSAAIRTGVRVARADWIATLDGDGQNDPADIPKLWHLATSGAGRVLVNGHRKERQDRWAKRWASWVANATRSRLLGDDTPDAGCGLKLFRRSLFLDLPYFDHMHRFLPALVLREGGTVYSVRVNHRPRRQGISKYGIFDRLGVGIIDLLGVMWLKRRGAQALLLDQTTPDPELASPPQAGSAL